MSEKVLVVDPSPLVRELCRRVLRGRAREIVQAGSGCEAFEMLQRHPDTDVVLLDIHLPAVSGLSVLAALRESKTYRAVPVILLSQGGDESAVARGLALGAEHAVEKYDNLEVLPELIALSRATAEPALSC